LESASQRDRVRQLARSDFENLHSESGCRKRHHFCEGAMEWNWNISKPESISSKEIAAGSACVCRKLQRDEEISALGNITNWMIRFDLF
jgi:hypothetical protein